MALESDFGAERASNASVLACSQPISCSEASVDVIDNNLPSAEYRKLLAKLDLRLLPPLFLLWFSSLIDRVNIGAARIQGLEKDLEMNPHGNKFNTAVGIYS